MLIAEVIAVRCPWGLISRAKNSIVVPDAISIESFGVIISAAFLPIACFSTAFNFSFSEIWRSLTYGFIRMALPWAR